MTPHHAWLQRHTLPQLRARRNDFQIVMGGGVNTVSGLEYLPRQDGSSNGIIGRYEVYLSNDSTTFGTQPVASGTWLDSNALKYVSWPATDAMAVKLVALTEAGNRGPWSSAAEFYINGVAASAPPYDKQGRWSPLVEMPLVPVAAATLPSGQVRLLLMCGGSCYAKTCFSYI